MSIEDLFKQALAKHPDRLAVGEWGPGALPLESLAERPHNDMGHGDRDNK